MIVVFVDRWSSYKDAFNTTEVAHGAAYSGLCRQVVLIQRCINTTEMAHGAAYSGLYRQVVFLYTVCVMYVCTCKYYMYINVHMYACMYVFIHVDTCIYVHISPPAMMLWQFATPGNSAVHQQPIIIAPFMTPPPLTNIGLTPTSIQSMYQQLLPQVSGAIAVQQDSTPAPRPGVISPPVGKKEVSNFESRTYTLLDIQVSRKCMYAHNCVL